jgi:hypothetical protein
MRSQNPRCYFDSIRNNEPGATETDASDLQSEKHDGQRILTLPGIVIDLRVENQNPSIRCASVENHRQMKAMKAICNRKNMMNKEF